MELQAEHLESTDPARVNERIEQLLAETERFVSSDNRRHAVELILKIRRAWGRLTPEKQVRAAVLVNVHLGAMFNILELLKRVEKLQSQGFAAGETGTTH